MAHAKKLSRKELKRPDEFVETGTKVMEWLQKNGTAVLTFLGALILLGVAIAVGSWWMEQASARAGAALGDALELADRPVLSEGAAAEADDPFFASEEEKKEKVAAALEAVRIDHDGTSAAAVATLQLADRAFRAGDFDKAAKRYDRFLASSDADNRLRFSALEGLGYTQEAKGDLEGALAAFERLGAEGGAFYKPYALVHQARVLEALGRTDDARLRAQQVLDAFSESPARARADAILGRLPPVKAPAAGGDEAAAAKNTAVDEAAGGDAPTE